MRVKDEEVTIEVFKARNFPQKFNSCIQLDDLELSIAKPPVIVEPSKPTFDELKSMDPPF